jgi:2-C-methyl-D-erythritol 4-phosphate cytidylyltransferase
MGLWGIVVAGGSGTRFGTMKQLEPLGGRRVLDLAVSALVDGPPNASVDGVVVVVPSAIVGLVDLPGDVVVAGGDSRAASVRAGLAAVPAGVDRVLVHDGARPLVPHAVVGRVMAGLDRAPAVVPVVAVTDSLRSVDGGAVDRSGFVAVQTPQGFHRSVLERAHDVAADASSATDDASLVDAIGENVLHVDGDAANIKITEPADLVVAEALLDRMARVTNEEASTR